MRLAIVSQLPKTSPVPSIRTMNRSRISITSMTVQNARRGAVGSPTTARATGGSAAGSLAGPFGASGITSFVSRPRSLDRDAVRPGRPGQESGVEVEVEPGVACDGIPSGLEDVDLVVTLELDFPGVRQGEH